MSNLLRNLLALIAGLVIGGFVNSGLIAISASVIPPPPAVDVTTAEGLAKGIALFEPRHFVMPFLAHALGTLAGAFVGYLVAATYRKQIAWAIGVLFLCGGIAAAFMIPAPAWFIAADLLLAYIPMAWLGMTLARGASSGVPRVPRSSSAGVPRVPRSSSEFLGEDDANGR